MLSRLATTQVHGPVFVRLIVDANAIRGPILERQSKFDRIIPPYSRYHPYRDYA